MQRFGNAMWYNQPQVPAVSRVLISKLSPALCPQPQVPFTDLIVPIIFFFAICTLPFFFFIITFNACFMLKRFYANPYESSYGYSLEIIKY
jgi:hypothetical protein